MLAERPRHSAGAHLFRFFPNAPATLGAVVRQRADLHRKRLLIQRRDTRIEPVRNIFTRLRDRPKTLFDFDL